MRVTNRADKPLGEVVPGVRRAIYFDAPEGSAQLSFGAAEVDPGKSIPVHRHKVADRGAEGILLGCTEIDLLVTPADSPVPVFDTTRLHAERAVELALAGVHANA